MTVMHNLEMILSSNIPPTRDEATSVKGLLDGEATTLSALLEDIAHLQNRLHILRERYQDSHAKVQRYQAVLSPVRLLPPELVRKVFLLCTEESVTELMTPLSNTPPLSLAQICSGWREVALATPELWKNIAFRGDSTNGIANFKNLMQLWLSRCHTTPIALTLSLQSQTAIDNLLLDVVAPYSTSIETLELHLETALFAAFADFPPEAFPRLRCIRFYGTRVENNTSRGGLCLWDPITAPFQFAPQLTDVFVSIPETKINLENLNLPWSQLSSLHLAETIVTSTAFLRILAAGSNLVSCSVRCVSENVTTSADSDIITLPFLTSLSLFMEAGNLAEVLRNISIPAIKTLSLRLVPHEVWYPDALIQLVSRSQCHLDRLSLSGLSVDREGFIALLNEMPTLQMLDVMFVSFLSDDVLDFMTPVSLYEIPVLPLLKVMKWREISLQCSSESIRQFIISRGWPVGEQVGRARPNVNRLERMIIKSTVGHFGSDWMKNLEEFRFRGLDLCYGVH
ncbi:hypothetical protein Agabi119p4_956 [Agaricus bisporus var. burnettii]|uniref:F-box domain-containing protein n=1 Tax=Agaricus bisporus var. burnettii TaxID=192524 RepID=A0A8H7FBS3_AGABI|nr:hypothetical protein Agabi119p4_956 [Agaricus bisporus var. burnettii]